MGDEDDDDDFGRDVDTEYLGDPSDLAALNRVFAEDIESEDEEEATQAAAAVTTAPSVAQPSTRTFVQIERMVDGSGKDYFVLTDANGQKVTRYPEPPPMSPPHPHMLPGFSNATAQALSENDNAASIPPARKATPYPAEYEVPYPDVIPVTARQPGRKATIVPGPNRTVDNGSSIYKPKPLG